jgi:hypothetical protein
LVQCSAVQCSAVQCSDRPQVRDQLQVATVQDLSTDAGKVRCSAVQCSVVQCSAVQCSAVQCSAVQVSAERSQASGWLWDQEHPTLHRLARRTAAMTGLETARPRHLLHSGIVSVILILYSANCKNCKTVKSAGSQGKPDYGHIL